MPRAAVGVTLGETAWGIHPVNRDGAALAAGQQGLTARLLIVGQPVPVLLLGDEAFASRIGQRIVLISRDVLQRDGQMPGPRVIHHEHHAELGQTLQNLVTTLTGQLGIGALEPSDFLQ